MFESYRRRAYSKRSNAGHSKIGRRVIIKPDWEQQKFTQMLGILTLKFDKPRLMLALQNTRDRDIIHRNNWHDTYWGTCTCSEHNGSGSNMLGYLLTIIRSSNRSEFWFFFINKSKPAHFICEYIWVAFLLVLVYSCELRSYNYIIFLRIFYF